MQDKTVVGLGYIARAGKDTIADYMVQEHGFRKTSFATALKEGIGRGVFGFSDNQLYGDEKEEIDEFWDNRLNIYEVELTDPFEEHQTFSTLRTTGEYREGDTWYDPEYGMPKTIGNVKRLPITPRLVLQLAGTEGGRNVFGWPLWVETVARRIQDSDHDRWVIPDVRFPNEAEAVIQWNGQVYEVEREVAHASGGTKGHDSETAMEKFDGWTDIVHNNSSFEDLYKGIEEIIISRL